MRAAPVGHQCADCVDAGAQSVRQPATALSMRPGTKPVLTYTLIALNLAVFAAQKATPAIYLQFVMWPWGVAHHDQVYRLLTSGFLHAGILHVLFNMVALYFTGPAVAPTMGPVMRFVFGTWHAGPVVARNLAGPAGRKLSPVVPASR